MNNKFVSAAGDNPLLKVVPPADRRGAQMKAPSERAPRGKYAGGVLESSKGTVNMREKGIKIKICGLCREQDIDFVNGLRPDYIGFVFAPKSHRYVTPVQAAALRKRLDPGIVSVGVFVNEVSERAASLLEQGIIGMAQLHGQEDDAYIDRLRQLTAKPILQAFRIGAPADIEKALQSKADGILLDNGAGGTGEAFDWSLLPKIERPWFLAGGLTPENVTEALNVTNPYGVDVSSGVETDKIKDYYKIKSFIENVQSYEENKA